MTAALLVWGLGAHAEEPGPLDAAVETSAGGQVQLKALWTKPTVLFYEDRDSTKLNQHVKDALFARGKERGLLESVNVVAVANVAKYDWFPARNFVLTAVREAEAQAHVPVYCDFKGQLAQPPWSLPSKTSTVVVLSPAGVPLLTFKGRLSEDEVTKLFTALDGLVAAH
jgi:hypothetical protein